MTPTNKLRFVERQVPLPDEERLVHTVRILQQWWKGKIPSKEYPGYYSPGEWRDVPLEEET